MALTAQQQPTPQLARLRRLASILHADVDHMETRILQDIVAQATSAHWDRRAAEFAKVGNPRCDDIAQACRNAALLHRWLQDPDAIDLAPAPRSVDTVHLEAVASRA